MSRVSQVKHKKFLMVEKLFCIVLPWRIPGTTCICPNLWNLAVERLNLNRCEL